MGLKDILRREFSLTSMRTRADRKYLLDSIKLDLEMWADYGDPVLLASIIERLSARTDSSNG